MLDALGLLDLLTGYQGASVVAAACRTGVFEVLDVAPDPVRSDMSQAGGQSRSRTPAEVADALGLAAPPVEALLASLAAFGLVQSGPDGYRAGPLGPRLRRDGDLALVVAKEAVFAQAWTELDETLRSGAPRLAPWRARLERDPAMARSFLEALVVLARLTGPDLTVLPAFAPGRKVLDVGGGLGTYAAPLATAGCDVTLVDLPPVVDWARETLAAQGWPAAGTAGSLHLLSGDLLDSADPLLAGNDAGLGSFDTALVSHVLHDLSDAQAAVLLRHTRDLLRPGGVLVVLELPGDADGPVGPLFDLMMQVETPGRARAVDALVALLHGAGLTKVHRAPAPLPSAVLQGVRP